MRRKQYGSNLLTQTVTHTPIADSGLGITKQYLLAPRLEKSEKLLEIYLQNILPQFMQKQ